MGSPLQPASRALSTHEKRDWLRLIRSQGVGPATFHECLARFGSAAEALNALADRRRTKGENIRICTPAEAESEMEEVDRFGARLIGLYEPDYPPLLGLSDMPPPLLCVKGDSIHFQKPALAIVGARNASAAGRKFAFALSQELSARGYLIVSGLARGIDTAAHEGALSEGTCAVVAGGIDIIYPPQNDALYHAIQAQGVAVAEMAFGIEPQARHFPRRNRIISGLSLGIVVVEAALRSGSLITARFGLEQGRDVFAVPGSPLDPRAAGTNDLIRQGACLVTCADDIISALQPFHAQHHTSYGNHMNSDGLEIARQNGNDNAPAGDASMRDDAPDAPDGMPDDNDRAMIAELLSPTPISIDDVIRLSGCPAPLVLAVLLDLELSGHLERHQGGCVSSRDEIRN